MDNILPNKRITKTASQFFTIINNQNGDSFANYDISDDLHLNSDNYKFNKIVFNNCTFRGLSIQNIEMSQGIHIIDCTLVGNTTFSNVNKSILNGDSNPILIARSNFQSPLQILSSNFSQVQIWKSETQSIKAQRLKISDGDFIFTASTCRSAFEFIDSSVKRNLYFKRVDFYSDFIITEATCEKIVIGKITIEGKTRVENINCSEISITNYSIIKNDFLLYKGVIASGMTLKNSTFEGEFKSIKVRYIADTSSKIAFDGVNFRKVCSIEYNVSNVFDGTIVSEISFIASTFDKGIIIMGPYITSNNKFILSKLSIDCSYHLEGTISISNFQIKEIVVGGKCIE